MDRHTAWAASEAAAFGVPGRFVGVPGRLPGPVSLQMLRNPEKGTFLVPGSCSVLQLEASQQERTELQLYLQELMGHVARRTLLHRQSLCCQH